VLLNLTLKIVLCVHAAGELLHIAEPLLAKNLHPTVICKGYARGLEDAVKIVEGMSFPIDINDRNQMLNVINSCIATKFTHRFGTLMAVRTSKIQKDHSRNSLFSLSIITCCI
jgi:chaperonin GroEL (HSP60 family)